MVRFLPLVLLVACHRGPPVSQLPLTPVAAKIGDVQVELQLPEGARETRRGEWERVSASQLFSVTVQVGVPAKLQRALELASQAGGSVVRSAQLSDGYALTTPTTSQRGIALEQKGVYCTARLNTPEGRPSAEQLAYLDSICASLRVLTN